MVAVGAAFGTAAALSPSLATAAASATTASATTSAKPPSYGEARIVSVDGPGRLTLKTAKGRFKMRLYMIDTPEVGECGAAESTAALVRLTKGRHARVRYGLWARKPDAEGRWPASIGPRKADFTEDSLSIDLVATEWARTSPAITISESDGITLRFGYENWGPRTLRGISARCGGLMHLPVGEPVPTTASARWTVNADGLTESIGPLVLPQNATAQSSLTVSDVEKVARVEITENGEGRCWARVPSLQLVLYVSTTKTTTCRTAKVEGIASSGPSHTSLTNGLHTGQNAADAKALFPRLQATKDEDIIEKVRLPLAGGPPGTAAWQTIAGLNRRGNIVGFATSVEAWD